MARFIVAVLSLAGFLSAAAAGTAPMKPTRKPVAEVKKNAPERQQEEQYVITDRTEIKLDGKECKFDDVPDDAEIVLLELKADRKTILLIHFESKK